MSKLKSGIETILRCPSCEVDRIRVLRVETKFSGVFENRLDFLGSQESQDQCDACGTHLVRSDAA